MWAFVSVNNIQNIVHIKQAKGNKCSQYKSAAKFFLQSGHLPCLFSPCHP